MIVSDRNELRRCVMHLWKNYNGLGLNLKNSKNQGQMPHMIRDVDIDSPAQYAGVLNNDLILKIGTRVVEYEKFDTILKLIKEQLRKEKKCDMLLINLSSYYDFKKKNEDERKNVDYSSPNVVAQIKYYESPLFNPHVINAENNVISKTTSSMNFVPPISDSPEPRLCHLLTWSNYDGYGFFVAYNQDGCYVKSVEPNSPAQMGGLRAYDRIVEVNSKQVNSKDREFIMKQISKHKKTQHTLTGSSSKKSSSKFGTNRSKKSTNGSNYLNILTVDPTTYKWLSERKVEISTRNKSLKFQECFTPSEYSLLNLMEKGQASSKVQQDDDLVSNMTQTGAITNELANNIVIKSCTIRRLVNKETEPLGFEMTKRGTQAHYLSRIEPGSSAALSGLCLNDYLIELNGKNIEQDENSVLREKIFDSLNSDGEFNLLTMNKVGYDYCVESKTSASGFIQINNQKIQHFETPKELSAKYARKSSNEEVKQSVSNNVSKSAPRLCVLRKTNETSELGLSIARMKNVNEHVINDVVPGSLAEQAGIRVNDCLLEVNGENVENKSHVETVNRIIELARQNDMSISLLVAERSYVLPNVDPVSTPVLKANILNDLKRAVSQEISNKDEQKTNDIYTSLSKATNLQATSNLVSDLPSINAYPEIKVCEFLGYPLGTQLGLVVTSDEYSHDVIKVNDDSPAQKAGLQQGDVIISVNDQTVEGNPTLIEMLNDFSETKPLKVLAASRYAYEWSKLLRIRIAEKDWPNIKKCSTKYFAGHVAHQGSTKARQVTQLPDVNQIYSNASYYEPENRNLAKTNMTLTSTADNYVKNTYSRPITPKELNTNSRNYLSASNHDLRMPSPRPLASRSYVSPRSQNNDQLSMVSNLSRSAVDITADGQVLRMCTLYLDPSSRNPADAEFGFDLVTKVGRQIGEYFIDTVDEDSPACVSGIKPGDRLVEVDGIEVKNKTFEQVVQIINEAKVRSRLKLLVHPSIIINYGNPNVAREFNDPNHEIYYKKSEKHELSQYKSMPDLTIQQFDLNQDFNNRQNEVSRNHYKNSSKKSQSRTVDYESVYKKRQINNNSYSKSAANIYGTTRSNESDFNLDSLQAPNMAYLRPMARLCTLYKNDQNHLQHSNSSNIGFGIQTKPNPNSTIPNYLRVSIVNYKSPAYLAGMEAGDLICEINGRSTLDMSHDESLYFIKSSYEINNYVKILVLSDFCYNWLKEHELLQTIRYDHSSIFSYADFLKHNQRFVPRLSKVRLFGHNKTFGFNLETLLIAPSSSLVSANRAAAHQSYAHIIVKLERESPAYAAGLRKGDRIIELDGINVEAENEKQVGDRIFQAFVDQKQLTLFVVDPETDHYFKSRCIKLHSMLPIVKHITNFSEN